MKFSVTKMAPELISPSEPTPSGNLPLSVADSTPMLMYYVETIIVFPHPHGKEAASVIREALAKALVPYYPVAGRLVIDPESGGVHVALTGEGAWFVQASADCTLEDVDFVQKQPLMIPKEQLLPSNSTNPGETDQDVLPFTLQPISFMLQVTQFKCGGFTLGFKCNHTMFDGMGAAQFMVAISEIARGLKEPTIKPVWCRDSIPSPNPTIPNPNDKINSSLPITMPPSDEIKLERCVIDLSLDYINKLTDQFMKETGQRCSSFDIAVAKLWQCRTRAIELPPHVTVTTSFPINVRHLLTDVLPSEGTGYYGNCFFVVTLEATSEKIANAPISEIVKLVRQGKESMPAKYMRMLQGVEAPPMGGPAYEKLVVVDLRRVGLFDMDYGWGKPHYVVPLLEHPWSSGSAYFVKSPPPMKGIRLIMQSVAKEHFEAFISGMKDSS